MRAVLVISCLSESCHVPDTHFYDVIPHFLCLLLALANQRARLTPFSGSSSTFMSRIFIPGSYPDDELWPDDNSLSPSSPPYSPQAVGSERVIEPSSSGLDAIPNVDLLWSPATSFIYESSLVVISLGSRVWGLRQPAYGFNGLVEGAIKLRRKCTHVVRVEVSVERPLLFVNVGYS
jgi:hypothetical protein